MPLVPKATKETLVPLAQEVSRVRQAPKGLAVRMVKMAPRVTREIKGTRGIRETRAIVVTREPQEPLG